MFWKYNIWGAIWTLLIFIACATPGEQLPPSPFIDFDKFIHLFFYGTLQLLLLRGFLLQSAFTVLRKYYLFITILFSSGYGVLIEILQGYVFLNRSFDLYDMVANVVGVALATIFWILFFQKRFKKI